MADFDRFCEERGIKPGEEPYAFAEWLAEQSGEAVIGGPVGGAPEVVALPEEGSPHSLSAVPFLVTVEHDGPWAYLLRDDFRDVLWRRRWWLPRQPPPVHPSVGYSGAMHAAEHHIPVVIATRRPTDLWRKRYWVVCLSLDCKLREGPWPDLGVARARCREIDAESQYAESID